MSYIGEVGKLNQAGTVTTLVVAVTTAPGAGSLLVLCGSGSVAVSTVTDTKGNTWTVDVGSASAPLAFIASTKQNVGTLTTSDTVTVTYSVGSSNRSAIIDEFTGVPGATPLDQTATGTGATTARTGGTTAATTQANELVIGCFAMVAAETSFTDGAGYSDFTTPFLAGLSHEYKIVSATGTQNPTATGGTSGTSHGVTATYKLANAPVNSVAPAVTGTAVVGNVLTTTTGTWS